MAMPSVAARGRLSNPATKGRLLILVALAAVLAGCSDPVPGAEQLNPHIDEYVSIPALDRSVSSYFFDVEYPTQLPADGYLAGKIVAVDPVSKKLDERLQRALPAEIRAAVPGEVATIVWVKWDEVHVGTYHLDNNPLKSSGEAYRGYCTVVVIDKAAGLIVGGRHFQAPEPPETTTEKGDIHTEVDVALVVAYLRSLSTTPSTPTPTSPAVTQSPAGQAGGPGSSSTATVIVRRINGTNILIDGARGMTLYVFASDAAYSGTSACNGSCANAWPPLTVPSGTTPTADARMGGKLGTITRGDGTTQVTYNGLPLYYYAGDSVSGDTTGNYPGWSTARP